MVTARRVDAFLASFTDWAAAQPGITAVALVGSWANGTARPDSDVDLVVVAADPTPLLADDTWLHRFGALRSVGREDWGLVQSRRVLYDDGLEVEFGVTAAAWLATDPLDPGTARVIRDGARVLLDERGSLALLVARAREP